MSRDLATATAAATSAAEVRPALFVFLDLDGGPVRIWSGVGDRILNSNTFTGLGTLAGVSPIEETTKVRAVGIRLTLSGIPSDVVSLALSEPYRGRPVTMWLALYDSAGALIGDAVQTFSGRIDTMSLEDTGETSMLSLSAESRLIDLERPRETRYTDEEQQRIFPGDTGLRYVAGLQEKELPWGVPWPTSSLNGGGNGEIFNPGTQTIDIQ
jgi:hypothetical protein